MEIPAQVEIVLGGIEAQIAEYQEQNFRQFGCYGNDERGWVSVANLVPGIYYKTQRYVQGETGHGWLFEAKFTNGTETMVKCVDHGPDGSGYDWRTLSQ